MLRFVVALAVGHGHALERPRLCFEHTHRSVMQVWAVDLELWLFACIITQTRFGWLFSHESVLHITRFWFVRLCDSSALEFCLSLYINYSVPLRDDINCARVIHAHILQRFLCGHWNR